MSDTQTVISDVKLFIERLKKELPEVFGGPTENAETEAGKILYEGKLYPARIHVTPDQEEGVDFNGSAFDIYLQAPQADVAPYWLKAAECYLYTGDYKSAENCYWRVKACLEKGTHTPSTIHDIFRSVRKVRNAQVKEELLEDCSGVLVPGGFGSRGIEGKILAIQYARTHSKPFLGLCLGMQLTIVEYARNVIGYSDAHSVELNPATTHPVIALMPDQNGVEDIGGTLRLGSYPCVLDKTSRAYELYGEETIYERHRHRYEVNNDYRNVLAAHGMHLSGTSPDGRIVEMCELSEHPFFVATQGHPELKSRPNRPHPLFKGFIAAALKDHRHKADYNPASLSK